MIIHFSYLIAPFFGYCIAGCTKLIINSLKDRQFALNKIGLGGMPSTHNTVTSTVATLIALREGLNSPALSVAICILLIVAIDSIGLRKHIEAHANIISKLHRDENEIKIRKKIGHTPFEAFAGIILGMICGWFLYASA